MVIATGGDCNTQPVKQPDFGCDYCVTDEMNSVTGKSHLNHTARRGSRRLWVKVESRQKEMVP